MLAASRSSRSENWMSRWVERLGATPEGTSAGDAGPLPSAVTRSPRFQHPERLREAAVGETACGGVHSVPGADHLVETVGLRMLARVRVQCRHLAVEHGGDVDVAVGALHPHHPGLRNGPRVEV